MVRTFGCRLRAFAGLLLGALIGSQPSLRAGSKLDRPHTGPFRIAVSAPRPDCWMLELFDQVARQADVPLGFEDRRGCWFSPRSAIHGTGARVLRAQTAREAFDEVAAMATGTFIWQEMDGVVVIRPADAWQATDDVLNLPTNAIHLINATIDDALYRALEATPQVRYRRPKAIQAYRLLDVRLSVDFAGGTLLRALNAIIRAKGDAEWRIAYEHDEAAIMIGSVSTLDSAQTTMARSITWNPRTAAVLNAP